MYLEKFNFSYAVVLSLIIIYILLVIFDKLQRNLHKFLVKSYQKSVIKYGDLSNIKTNYLRFYIYLKKEEIVGFIGILPLV